MHERIDWMNSNKDDPCKLCKAHFLPLPCLTPAPPWLCPAHPQVCTPTDVVESINDTYWNLRAEVVPPEEEPEAMAAAGDMLAHVYHFTAGEADSTAAHVTCFGEPFFMKVQDRAHAGTLPALQHCGYTNRIMTFRLCNLILCEEQPVYFSSLRASGYVFNITPLPSVHSTPCFIHVVV